MKEFLATDLADLEAAIDLRACNTELEGSDVTAIFGHVSAPGLGEALCPVDIFRNFGV